MSGRRSDIARKRRRRERRNAKQVYQERKQQTYDHGNTTNEPIFDKPTTSPCPDCNLENRLRSTDLRPAPIGAIPLKPTRLSSWRPVASIGCETCGGSGAINLDEYDQVDPYDIASRSESRENALGLKEWRQGLPPTSLASPR